MKAFLAVVAMLAFAGATSATDYFHITCVNKTPFTIDYFADPQHDDNGRVSDSTDSCRVIVDGGYCDLEVRPGTHSFEAWKGGDLVERWADVDVDANATLTVCYKDADDNTPCE